MCSANLVDQCSADKFVLAESSEFKLFDDKTEEILSVST